MPTQAMVADQILDYLKLEGATTIFGVPGAGVMHFLQRLHDRHEFTYVVCRHETGAAYMADGYYRATGKPGVVLVTSGPGATNALTGSANAFFGGSAVLVLTGEVSEQYLGRGYLQEGVDCGLNVRDIYAAATRYSADIEDASSGPIMLEQALREMPVHPPPRCSPIRARQRRVNARLDRGLCIEATAGLAQGLSQRARRRFGVRRRPRSLGAFRRVASTDHARQWLPRSAA